MNSLEYYYESFTFYWSLTQGTFGETDCPFASLKCQEPSTNCIRISEKFRQAGISWNSQPNNKIAATLVDQCTKKAPESDIVLAGRFSTVYTSGDILYARLQRPPLQHSNLVRDQFSCSKHSNSHVSRVVIGGIPVSSI